MGTYLPVRNTGEKSPTRPHGLLLWGKQSFFARGDAGRWACGRLASWWGKSLPGRRSVAGLRGRAATLGLRYGPDSYGRQQRGILRNGRKPDAATPRG